MSYYGTKEARLIEQSGAWKHRALFAEERLRAAELALVESRWATEQLELARATIKAIGERTAPRAPRETAEGTRAER
jgi:hypothetical protein